MKLYVRDDGSVSKTVGSSEWRNGSASDSSPEGCGFKSRFAQNDFFFRGGHLHQSVSLHWPAADQELTLLLPPDGRRPDHERVPQDVRFWGLVGLLPGTGQ